MTNPIRSLVLGCSILALAACGADDVVAPGGNIVTPTPTPGPAPTPTPAPGSVTAAASCTAGTTDGGTIVLQNDRGTIRNCLVPTQVSGNLTLSGRRADGIMYSLNGRTDVGRDIDLAGGEAATLTILPGVTVFGATRDTSLIVNRGSKILAEGSAAQPIVFTALGNLTGAGMDEAVDNLWGGIIVNGRAPVSDCAADVSTSLTGGSAGCWRKSEGVAVQTLYGGDAANDDSGVFKYVQVNFTGVGSNGDEVQGITLNGVGRGTDLSYVQVHNSRDDGIEVFGGTINMSHLILTGNADDSLDTDVGYDGAMQFALVVRRANGAVGDSVTNQTAFEIDSTGAEDSTPRQKLKVANFTFIQPTPGEPVFRIRGGADVIFANGVVVAPVGGEQGCLDVDGAQTVQAAGAAAQEDGPPVFQSVVFDCQLLIDADADAFEETALANPANTGLVRDFTSTLRTLTGSTVGEIANGTNESGVAAVAALTAISSFFEQVDYIGAFSGPDDLWTQGWTCNSDVADLRGETACVDIRIS